MHVVGVSSRYMSKLGNEHWKIVKRVLRYLCGTVDHVICYQGKDRSYIVLDVHGFVNTNWDGYLDNRRSASGYVFNLFGGAINWISKKHAIVALSTK